MRFCLVWRQQDIDHGQIDRPVIHYCKGRGSGFAIAIELSSGQVGPFGEVILSWLTGQNNEILRLFLRGGEQALGKTGRGRFGALRCNS
jgi:hypothetical protein